MSMAIYTTYQRNHLQTTIAFFRRCAVLLPSLLLAGCFNYAPAGVPLGTLDEEQYKNFTYSESYAGKGNATYKIGKPYQIKGTWYYPEVNYDYSEVGIASWYGPKFHNKKTANGEIFDQNALTGAHRTLPLPSIVIVQNLENGRSVKLRINDRGPFARGRIIDVSKRASEVLGFSGEGTAPVKVTVVADESRRLAQALGGKQEVMANNETVNKIKNQKITIPESEDVGFQSLPEPAIIAGNAGDDTTQAKKPQSNITFAKIDFSERVFIQIGAFVEEENIDRSILAFAKFGYPVLVQEVGRDNLKRILVGPLNTLDKDKIEELLEQTIKKGYEDSHIYLSE